MLSRSLNGGCCSRQLPNETWHAIVSELSKADQLSLALSCRRFYRLVRKQVLGVGSPEWIDAQLRSSEHGGPPASAYRNAVSIRDTVYLPMLCDSEATCWMLEILPYPTKWIAVPIVHTDRSFRPVVNPAVTSLNTSIYVFGGEDVLTGIPTNTLYEISANTLLLQLLPASSTVPAPRSMASLDVLDSHRLVLFGGRCLMPNGKGYDTRELCIYDITARRWHIVPVPSISNFPTPRSLHSTVSLAGRLYVYGGEFVTSFSGTHVHEDADVHCWDCRGKWLKFLSAAPGELTGLCLPPEWIPTKGHGPEPRRGACIFKFGRSCIAIVGGNADALSRVDERPWEYMYILNPDTARYVRVRVTNLPRMDCICFIASSTNSVFVLGVDPEHRRVLAGYILD